MKDNLALRAKKIVLIPLPTYAPWENPIEKVWGLLKKELLVHHPYGKNWKLLKENVKKWLEKYQGESSPLLHLCGINKKKEDLRYEVERLVEQGQVQHYLDAGLILPS